jgi:hypothetical protein
MPERVPHQRLAAIDAKAPRQDPCSAGRHFPATGRAATSPQRQRWRAGHKAGHPSSARIMKPAGDEDWTDVLLSSSSVVPWTWVFGL